MADRVGQTTKDKTNCMRPKTTTILGATLALLGFTLIAPALAESDRAAKRLHEYTLVPTGLEALGYTTAEIDEAEARGLTFRDLPSIGSGLQHLHGNHYLGVTDRGASYTVTVTTDTGSVTKRIFPLPQFTPTIVFYRATHDDLTLEAALPLVGASGAGVTGIPNSKTEDSVPFLNLDSAQIPFNPSGMDIEDVHTLPSGGFILVEEYSPSVVIADENGVVLRRYTPVSKTLSGADYPVSNTLPDVLTNRRGNRGFESMAVSPDGRTAYTLTQSPMGSTAVGSPSRDSRVVRVLRMDVSDPLNLEVTGQFAVYLSRASDYPVGNAQRDLKISAAAWVARDVLLLLEVNDAAGIGGLRLLLVDLRRASNFHGRPVAETLDLEDVTKGPIYLGLRPAITSVVYQQFETDLVHLLPSGKLEGLSILNDHEVAISNDNDFGIGDVPGTPSTLTVLHLRDPLPLKRH